MKKLLLAGVALVIFLKWDLLQDFMRPTPDYAKLQVEPVVLYATEWCGYCKATRRLLSEHNIDYYEYDIEKSEEGRRQYRSLGGRGVPVLLINGEVVKGFNASEILRLAQQ